jgi:hypothetical protein
VEITAPLNVAEQTLMAIFRDIWSFCGISNFLFIFLRFLADPLTMFYGTLEFRGTPVGKHCPIVLLYTAVHGFTDVINAFI